MKRTAGLLLAALLALALVACSSPQQTGSTQQPKHAQLPRQSTPAGETASAPQQEGEYQATYQEFAYSYPASATVSYVEDTAYVHFGTLSFVILYEATLDISSIYQDELAIGVQGIKEHYMDLFEVVDFSELQETTVAGNAAMRYNAELLGPNEAAGEEGYFSDYRFETIIFPAGENAYVANYLSPASLYNKYYDAYKALVNSIVPLPAGQWNGESPAQAAAPERTYANASDGWYTSGIYLVGTDIPAGEYYLESTASLYAYMAVYSDEEISWENAIMSENFGSSLYITVDEGQYLEITDGRFAQAETVEKSFDAAALGEGMYKVGVDIPPGEYKLENTGGVYSFVFVYKSSYLDYTNLVNSGHFENTKHIRVSEGQYLYIRGCTGELQE